jgi:Protein of unknown function (DUF998)
MQQIHSSSSLQKLAKLTAYGALVVVIILVVVAGAFTPGYNHIAQLISELGASGSRYGWPVRFAGFLPAGLLLLTFCFFAYRLLQKARGTTFGLIGLAIYAVGYLVAAAFPCDLGCRPNAPSASQMIHNAGGLVGYLLAPVFLFSLARAARTWPAAGHLVVAGYVAFALALFGLLTLSPSSPAAGLSQRLLEASVLGWVAMCGHYLAKRPASETKI